MKRTRNFFVLAGAEQNVQHALEHIQFKGVTVLLNDELSVSKVSEVFSNNKSVVAMQYIDCPCSPITIMVINDKSHLVNDACSINIALGDIANQFKSIAESLECDIGDHKSNSSGLTDTVTLSDCAYCRYIRHESTLPERSIYSSEHFFVIPTLGEFVPGYLLIIPYQHVMSNAELSFSIQEELLTVIEDVQYLLKLTYQCSDCLVWENGTGNSGKGKAKDSVVHAHTHIVPSTLTAEKIEDLSGLYFEKISTKDLSKYNQNSYLLIKDAANTWRISSNPSVYIPRQYVRQLLADEYEIPGEQWNWREFPFKEQMMQTYYDMARVIRRNWNNLPKRIQANTLECKDSSIK